MDTSITIRWTFRFQLFPQSSCASWNCARRLIEHFHRIPWVRVREIYIEREWEQENEYGAPKKLVTFSKHLTKIWVEIAKNMWPFHPLSFFFCWHKKHSKCSDIRLSAYMHKEIDVFPLLISYTQTVTEMPKCISKECGFRLLCFILLFVIERPQLHISKYVNTQFCLQCTHHSSKREHIQKFEIKNNTNNGTGGKNGRNKTNNNNNNITINYKTWCCSSYPVLE